MDSCDSHFTLVEPNSHKKLKNHLVILLLDIIRNCIKILKTYLYIKIIINSLDINNKLNSIKNVHK